jgi:hypothetical protein
VTAHDSSTTARRSMRTHSCRARSRASPPTCFPPDSRCSFVPLDRFRLYVRARHAHGTWMRSPWVLLQSCSSGGARPHRWPQPSQAAGHQASSGRMPRPCQANHAPVVAARHAALVLQRPPSLCSRVLCCASETQGAAYDSMEHQRICAP